MSLINEMLKDLEARGGNEPVSNDVRSPAPRSRASRRIVPVLGLLVIALSGTVAWLVARDIPEPPEAIGKAAAATPSATATRPATDAPAVSIATVAPPIEIAATAAPATATAAPASMPVPAEATPENADPAASPEVPHVAEPATPADDATETVIVRRHEPTPAQRAARASREGFAALNRDDWDTAARLLGELVLLEPANDDAREGLVIALAQQGRIAEADGVLLDGLAVGVTPARFAKLRARLLASQGDLAEALQSLAIAVPAVADDPEFHALKGALAHQAGEHAIAAQAYRMLVAHAPGNGTWQAGLGMALDQAGDASGARAAYERAVAAGDLDAALLDHARERLAALSDENDGL